MEQRYIVALEFSGSQVKGAFAHAPVSEYSPISTPTVDAVVHVDKTECVQYGRVQNIIQAFNDAKFVKQRLENDPKLKHGLITCAFVGLSGRSLCSIQTSGEIVLPEQKVITEEILKHLYIEATKTLPSDRRMLKVVPRKYVIDNQVTNNPVGSVGTCIRGEFTVVVCNPDNHRNLQLVLNENLRLPVKEYVVTPLAIADMVLGEEEKQLGCVLVDLGAQTTTISIYKDRALQYLATLPLGSHNITRDIAKGLSITIDRAEEAKKQKGNAIPEPANRADDESNRVNAYVQARAGEIIANIIAQIGFANFKAADLPSGFILTGRGAKLKNFAQALEAQSKMKVRHATIPASVTVADQTVDSSDYISLIAILQRGANVCDELGCVSIPEEEPVVEEAMADDRFDPFDTRGDSDRYWTDDTDRESRRRANDERRAEAERRKRAEKQAKEAAAAAAEADKKKKKEEEERLKEEQRARARASNSGILRKIQNKVVGFFTADDDDDGDDIKFNPE